MEDFIQWEFAMIAIAIQTDMIGAMNKMGEEGWEPWAILGQETTPTGVQVVQLGIKRHKRKISLSTDINSALRG